MRSPRNWRTVTALVAAIPERSPGPGTPGSLTRTHLTLTPPDGVGTVTVPYEREGN